MKRGMDELPDCFIFKTNPGKSHACKSREVRKYEIKKALFHF